MTPSVGRVGAAILAEVEVRELVTGGADQLVALFAAVLPGSPAARADQLDDPEAFLQEPSSFVLGAYIEDAPVGLAGLPAVTGSSSRSAQVPAATRAPFSTPATTSQLLTCPSNTSDDAAQPVLRRSGQQRGSFRSPPMPSTRSGR